MTQRYFIGYGPDYGRFLVPVEHYVDWVDFVNNEARWDGTEPAYARRIGANFLTFTDPKLELKIS